MKKAIITGVSGQDGAYLAQLLLNNDYHVFGLCRGNSAENLWRLSKLGILGRSHLKIISGDLSDGTGISQLIEEIKPDEVYNLAAQSSVGASFKSPLQTGLITGMGALHVMEAARLIDPSIRIFQASSAEMFGPHHHGLVNEQAVFSPKNPYGIAKLYAHTMAQSYRDTFNMFITTGILFNHESPLRGFEFVTRKITNAAAQIKLGLLDQLQLGNLDSQRDWGCAKEFVDGIYRITQAHKASDYVLATGRAVTVRDFVRLSFQSVGIDLCFEGSGLDEIGVDKASGAVIVSVNPEFYRPVESKILVGDASKASQELGWQAKTPLEELCSLMVKADLAHYG